MELGLFTIYKKFRKFWLEFLVEERYVSFFQLQHETSTKLKKLVNGKRISIRSVPIGKTGLPFQNFRLSREFSSGTNQKIVYPLHSNWNFLEFVVNGGCLPFTWANRQVYGLGKWYAKFRTGKFSSGIAFTICTDQFHLTENGREGLKLVSKMALRKWNTNFRLEYFVRKNRTTFSDVPLLPEIFRWEDPKSRVPFTFEPDFPENSCPKAKFPAGLG